MNFDSDFTLGQYLDVLRIAKKKYEFISFDEIDYAKNFILWRHDCDLSLNRALHTARLEAQCDLKATYFLNIHSEFYNLMEKSQTDIVKEILKLGHDIGLHFDAHYYLIKTPADLVNSLTFEAGLLETVFGVPIKSFSFHNPTTELLKFDEEYYGNLLNCYSKKLKQTLTYCSDSNGIWRHQRLRDLLSLSDAPYLHILTHPGWWQDEVLSPYQRVERSVYGRAEALLALYNKSLREFGR